MGRSEVLRSMFNATGLGLEIGPSHNPLMAKAAGFEVEILDYLDAEGLRRKYSAAGVDVSAVEEVDYISDGRPMTEVIGDYHRYNWIVASHVIEHVPDLLAFLLDCEALLKPEGVLVLAVPDKRCCFDVLRPLSSIGQVLQAHVDGRKKPPPGVIVDDVAYARKRGGRIGWPLEEQSPLEQVRPIEDAKELFEQARTNDSYVDMHCWVFVPSSFRLVIRTLAEFRMIGLRELKFRGEDGEFYVTLSTQVPLSTALDFGQLAVAAQEEERATIFGPVRYDALAREGATERLSAITASKSWKLTAPLRAIARVLRALQRSRSPS